MAKDRLIPCIYYISKGQCSKGREAEQYGYCQHCNKYKPRKGGKNLIREIKHKYKEKKYENY